MQCQQTDHVTSRMKGTLSLSDSLQSQSRASHPLASPEDFRRGLFVGLISRGRTGLVGLGMPRNEVKTADNRTQKE